MDNDVTEFVISERDFQLKRLEEIRTALAEARETGNWDLVPKDVYHEYLAKIIVTASTTVANRMVVQELNFISAESIFSVVLPDFSLDIQDETSVDREFQAAKEIVLQKLRGQALTSNADAITGIRLKHTLLDAASTKKRFLIVGTGTAVKLN